MDKSPDVLMQVGGPVDEVSAVLAVYGMDLEPDDVALDLGIEPTRAHRAGETSKSGVVYPHGAFIVERRGVNGQTASVLESLLSELPTNVAVWEKLRSRYSVQIRLAMHVVGFNQGFGMTSAAIRRIADIGAEIVVDIYAYGDE